MTQTPGLIAFLDFEKAFDSIEWDFIEKALHSFGFGKHFTNWVRIIYTDINASVMNNGYTTEYFYPKRGIRQGCPLSAYLFILAAEYLAVSIRNDKNIHGIQISDINVYGAHITIKSNLRQDLLCYERLLWSGTFKKERKIIPPLQPANMTLLLLS